MMKRGAIHSLEVGHLGGRSIEGGAEMESLEEGIEVKVEKERL